MVPTAPFFLATLRSRWDLSSLTRPGIKPMRSLNHWTTREVPPLLLNSQHASRTGWPPMEPLPPGDARIQLALPQKSPAANPEMD